jgi:D-aspartate ligase
MMAHRVATNPRGYRGPAGDRPPAVVVGLDSITGLQTARILASYHIPVIGLVASMRHWAAFTNSCADVIASPLSGPGLVDTLLTLGRPMHGPMVLFPCTDLAVDTCSAHQPELTLTYRLPLSPHPLVQTLADKAAFADHARKTGLPVPRTEVLQTRDDAKHAATTLTFPAVVKPSVKGPRWTAATATKGFVVTAGEELVAAYDRCAKLAGLLIAQEWVPGPRHEQYTCNAYFGADGTPLVTFVTRKIRQWPPEVGIGCAGVEVRNDEVAATTVALFGGVRFHGLAYLEMKRDARNGQLVVIEPNVGRPTGRSATAEAGGVQLLQTVYCDALGLPLPANRTQRYVGAGWVDLRRDLQAICARHEQPVRAADWLRFIRGNTAHAIWSADDPAPFAVDLAQAAARGLARALHRLPPRHAAPAKSEIYPEPETAGETEPSAGTNLARGCFDDRRR